MKKNIYVFLLIICIISFGKLIFVISNNKNINYESKKEVVGKITYIEKKQDKVLFVLNDKVKYQITTYNDFNYELGDYIKVKGLFYIPKNNSVFNLFNYRKYLLSKNIKEICNRPNSISLVKRNKNIIYFIKNKLIKKIGNLKSGYYVSAFILGDTSSIKEEIKEGYNKLGISHLFSISGMHVGLIIIVLNKLLKKVKHKDIIIYTLLIFFAFITSFPIGILRCILFMLINKLNKLFELNIKTIYQIVLVAFILLLINSYLIYNIGFLFSITITFFIILSDKYIKNKTYLKKVFIISTISFFASIPILAYNFFSINFLSILLNVLFVPFISFVMFPISILTLIIPYIDNIYVYIINIFEKNILFFNKFNIFTFIISKPNLVMIFLYYFFLFISIKFKIKYIIFFFIILIYNLLSSYFIFDNKILFLDVSQGDSSIIIGPKGKTTVIDTGGIYNSYYSISLNIIKPYLNSIGINKIGQLIITHGDYDHMGETINLVNNFKVEKVIFNCGEFNELEQELIKILDKKKIPYYSCIKELNIDDYKLYFLNNKDYGNENDNSSVIYTELNNYKFIFMGDAGVEVEEDLIKKYNLQDVDVLKVGHHGSKTSSGKNFIDEINPKYSIISVGKNNRYGHPNKEVLNTLEDSKLYRTDQDGSIMFKIKNDKLQIETCVP